MGRRYPAGLSLTQICNCFVIAWEAAGEDYEAVLPEARVEENTLYRVTASGVLAAPGQAVPRSFRDRSPRWRTPVGPLHFTGFFAWLTWIAVHIFYLIGFRNRLLVLIQYAWAYVTFQPGARIILPEESAASTKAEIVKK